MKKRSIVLVADPLVGRNQLMWKGYWCEILMRVALALSKGRLFDQIVMVIGEAHLHLLSKIRLIPRVTVVVVSYGETLRIAKNSRLVDKSGYSGVVSAESNSMAALMHAKLAEFCPDLIWSFSAPVNYLRKVFPDAEIIHQELGALGRAANVPLTWYLDLDGTFAMSSPNQSFPSAKGSELSPRGLASEIMSALTRTMNSDRPVSREALEALSSVDFKYFALVPLQYSGYYIFDEMCDYGSQLEFLLDVLERCDSRIGVVATEHPNSGDGKVLTEHNVNMLRRRYPNFLFQEGLTTQHRASMRLLPAVDAVISVSSTIGQLGSLSGKAVICPGVSNLSPIADSDNPEALLDILSGKIPRVDSEPYWDFYFNRYCIPDAVLDDSLWLEGRLAKWMDSCGSGLERYDQIWPQDKLARHYLNAFKFGVPQKAKAPARNIERQASESRSMAELERDLRAMRQSLSWRITAPLRWLADKVWFSRRRAS